MAQLRGAAGDFGIFGTKIMAPLGDAMRLVDGEQTDLGVAQKFERFGRGEALRRKIEQF